MNTNKLGEGWYYLDTLSNVWRGPYWAESKARLWANAYDHPSTIKHFTSYPNPLSKHTPYKEIVKRLEKILSRANTPNVTKVQEARIALRQCLVHLKDCEI
ncbi:MAG TPA: hypothetical protein ENI23_10560 [bacterium]|nr:hypothetical protein [bacterium]